MGTSSRHNGPNRSPLLPPNLDLGDFDLDIVDEEENNQDDQIETNENNEGETQVTWQNAKSIMTRFVKSQQSSPNRAISNYVKASGGAKNITRSSIGGIRSSVALGSFVNQVNSTSFKDAMVSLGFQMEGKSVEDVLTFLAESLSPNPSNKEDAVARKAMIETLVELYEEIDQNNDSVELLDQINQEYLNNLTSKFIINYVFEKLLSELGTRFEDGSATAEQAVAKEIEVRDYITAVVETSQKMKNIKTKNFKSPEIMSFVASTYAECYSLLENI